MRLGIVPENSPAGADVETTAHRSWVHVQIPVLPRQ
jgi:hypothetical protein